MKKLTNKKKILILSFLAVCLILSIIWYFQSFHQTLNPKNLSIGGVSVTSNEIKINGYSLGLFEYDGLETTYENKILYIKFKGGVPFPFVERTTYVGDFSIENKYPDLEKIYLRKNDNDNNDRLIWSTQTGQITNRYDDPLNPFKSNN